MWRCCVFYFVDVYALPGPAARGLRRAARRGRTSGSGAACAFVGSTTTLGVWRSRPAVGAHRHPEIMSTGGVSSGKVSTAIRGVSTPAKTTSAMQSIRIATGRPVTGPSRRHLLIHGRRLCTCSFAQHIAERLDLLQQPVDQLLRAAHGQRRNVIDRLVRIELGALAADLRQRIDDRPSRYPRARARRSERCPRARRR